MVTHIMTFVGTESSEIAAQTEAHRALAEARLHQFPFASIQVMGENWCRPAYNIFDNYPCMYVIQAIVVQ